MEPTYLCQSYVMLDPIRYAGISLQMLRTPLVRMSVARVSHALHARGTSQEDSANRRDARPDFNS